MSRALPPQGQAAQRHRRPRARDGRHLGAAARRAGDPDVPRLAAQEVRGEPRRRGEREAEGRGREAAGPRRGPGGGRRREARRGQGDVGHPGPADVRYVRAGERGGGGRAGEAPGRAGGRGAAVAAPGALL